MIENDKDISKLAQMLWIIRIFLRFVIIINPLFSYSLYTQGKFNLILIFAINMNHFFAFVWTANSVCLIKMLIGAYIILHLKNRRWLHGWESYTKLSSKIFHSIICRYRDSFYENLRRKVAFTHEVAHHYVFQNFNNILKQTRFCIK